MMKLWRWEKGRQNTGYEKLLLLGSRWLVLFDVYLLKFGEGVSIPSHVDKVEKGRHFRINIILKKAKSGGDFICETPIYESERIKFFRPDIVNHAVSKIEDGTRYVLSIGWIRT